MPYIVPSHVEVYNPARAPFTPATKPTFAGVVELIAEAEGDVTAALLEGGYPDPIASTSAAAYRQVQTAVAKVAAALVEQVAPNSQKSRIDNLKAMADSALEALRCGALVGIDRTTSLDGPRWNAGASAYFTKDMEF